MCSSDYHQVSQSTILNYMNTFAEYNSSMCTLYVFKYTYPRNKELVATGQIKKVLVIRRVL